MLSIKVKCTQCQEIFWIPISKWSQRCQKCEKIGLLVLEQRPNSSEDSEE